MTEEPFTVRKQNRPGIAGWVSKGKLLSLLMNAQQESSLRLARHLVGDARFLRVNFTASPNTYSLDGPNEIEELAGLGNRIALQQEVLGPVKSRFLNGVSVMPWERF
jgi:hypothetical protein